MMTQSADSEAGWADGVGAPPFLNWPTEVLSHTGVVLTCSLDRSRHLFSDHVLRQRKWEAGVVN
jgi:hypothetical protein